MNGKLNRKETRHTPSGARQAGGGAARGMVRSTEAKDLIRRGQEEVRPSVIESVKRSAQNNALIWEILSKH